MSDVTCTRCGETREGLAKPPLPGAIGEAILVNTCTVCWDEWKEQQIKVINHYSLRPQFKEDREKLYEITRQALNLPGE